MSTVSENTSDNKMISQKDDADKRSLALLSIGHFTVDMCQGVLPLLLPFLLTRLGLDYTATAFIVTVAYITSSVAQPLFGFLSLPALSRVAPIIGPGIACLFLALAAQANSYPLLLGAVVLSSIGVALYHPESVARANAAAGTVRKGRGMSIFALSGSMGFSCGALIFGPLLAVKGLHAALWLLVPALAIPLLLGLRLPTPATTMSGTRAVQPMPRAAVVPMTLLVGTVALRQWAMAGTLTFLPLYMTRYLHGSPATASQMVFALQLGGDAGTLLCGWLAERWGYQRSMVLALTAACPLLVLYPFAQGSALMPALLFLSGVMLAIPVLGSTMIGQAVLPENKPLAASLTLGFGVGIGGIGSGLLGYVADTRGLPLTLILLAVAPGLGALLALWLPKASTR